MKASLIVRSASGKLLHVADPIHVDDESVKAEFRRLRAIYGTHVTICMEQVAYARQAMEQEALTA